MTVFKGGLFSRGWAVFWLPNLFWKICRHCGLEAAATVQLDANGAVGKQKGKGWFKVDKAELCAEALVTKR